MQNYDKKGSGGANLAKIKTLAKFAELQSQHEQQPV
jgi:hypothetical protein